MPLEIGYEVRPPDYFFSDEEPLLTASIRPDLRYITATSFARLEPLGPKGIDPFDYVRYSKQDLQDGGERGVINAIKNAKQAIHLGVECFLVVLALDKRYDKENFPTKLELISELEAFPTNVLKTLNRRRNVIEHDYESAEYDEAQELVDVAEMFAMLATLFARKMVFGGHVGLPEDDRDIRWEINYDNYELLVIEQTGAPWDVFEEPLGKVYYSYWRPSLPHEKEHGKPEHKMLDRIPLNKARKEEWLPIFNLFIYCTKKYVLLERDITGKIDEGKSKERQVRAREWRGSPSLPTPEGYYDDMDFGDLAEPPEEE